MAELRDDGAHRSARRAHARNVSAAGQGRPQGTRFRTAPQAAPSRTVGAPARRMPAPAHGRPQGRHGVQPAYQRRSTTQARRKPIVPIIVVCAVAVALIAAIVLFVVPAVGRLISGSNEPAVEAGIEVQINIPQGASGDQIASILSQNHIIEDPKEYYATVSSMQADALLKPGDYLFTTLQDPEEVVQQLIDGPNVKGVTLTIPEGLTVQQTAERVQETYGISADDFLAQAKASNYVSDYPFLEGAYNDSLEGYLYPKTYSFQDDPTADEVIRAMLDQFETETAGLNLTDGANGLTAQQIVIMASLIERESSVESERSTIASVIYNRLDEGMPLQIDAAIVYARGGGSGTVTYDDLEIDSPYNVYQNTGLTPGPICSPSVSSIQAALNPDDTNYLYYVLSSAGDGSHKFSETYDEFQANVQEYRDSQS